MNTQNRECTDLATRPAIEETASVIRPSLVTHEDESGVRLEVALPGVRKEDLKLTFHDSHLRLVAPRRDDVPTDWKTRKDGGGPVRYEFTAAIADRLDANHASASLENGVLTLRLPLREEAKPRTITVN